MQRRAFLLILSVFLVSGLAAAPQAVLGSLKGKVEVRAPGTTVWAPAVEGQILAPASTISTGFDSSAVVLIDKTTIQVKPLTRMTLDKLVEESGVVKTSTFLRVGSVSASVKSAEGVKQDFKVQSPYSTASVRGTEFDFDGLKLKVREGVVAFIMGRSKRSYQPIESAGGPEGSVQQVPVDSPEDYAGAPDVEANEDEAVPVPAGEDATLNVDFAGGDGGSISGSADRDKQGPGTATPGVRGNAIKKGGVELKIEFAR